jgi:N-acetyltransferase
MLQVKNIQLEGQRVRLAPLAPDHCDDLVAAVRDGDIFRRWFTNAPEPEQMRDEIAARMAQARAGTLLPFAVVLPETGRAVGMTSYMNIDAENDRLEIGSTWYAQSCHRTGVNVEAKLLLLRHAFETLGCIAVELRTHVMNVQSRRAIEALGAKLDGILRNHRYARNGTIRDTAVYSIIAHEWPAVCALLKHRLARCA